MAVGGCEIPDDRVLRNAGTVLVVGGKNKQTEIICEILFKFEAVFRQNETKEWKIQPSNWYVK